ncbi:unnamed protein product [Bathycoccus prasinos]
MTNYSSQHRDFLTPEVIFTTSIFKSNFDLKLFEFHEKEIAIIDPQQRILLILCHPILKRDQNGKRNESSKSVFVGISTSEYSDLTPRSLNELGSAYSATASALSVASGRVSFCFDLRGPSMSIDTACSSSLVAMHLGAKSCNQDECSASLVCGVNLILLSRTTEIFQRAGMLSRDGRCKTLDSTADGYVRSEGCEVLHLIRGYDGLHTVIVSGSAVNQDGRSSSLTAPNGPSQRVVIETALENACADACSLSKFYMHGTGTSLGDPIEIGGILSVVGHFDRMKFSISAVKTYFGHSECASGISSILCAVQQLEYSHKWNTENMPSISARFGSFINNIEMFDASIFSINSVEAQMMDPQQRLLLMEVLNSKACVKKLTDCSEILPEVGVYIGITSNYFNISFVTKFTHYSATGQQPSVASGRLSYIFGWIGPALSIDTACSSSLVGVHQGFIYCNTAEYTTRKKAVCSGCHIITSQWSTMLCDAAGMLSTDGRCKALDDRADGYVRGEAIEILTIERKENVMKSSCVMTTTVNQDGRSSALTAPNGYAQYSIIKESLNSICTDAKVAINGAELHGTGTVLGDPIELGSIQKAILHYGKKNEAIVLSAIKSLLGHGETGAGITSLLCGLKKTFKLQCDIDGKEIFSAFISRVIKFGISDSIVYSISKEESCKIDPQHLLLLTKTCKIIAGLCDEERRDIHTGGVFVGISTHDASDIHLLQGEQVNQFTCISSSSSIASGRVSFCFDLRGPSMSIDTACSSSLVAMHLGAKSCNQDECSVSLVCGVNLILLSRTTEIFQRAGMLSRDGRCKTLDSTADGYVRSEGCEVLHLIRGYDGLHTVIVSGSAVNQDGRSSSLTAPNGPSQRVVIETALENACADACSLSKFYMHGTGTSLGDPIEIGGILSVVGHFDRMKFSISAVKTYFGHSECASGISSILCAVQQLEYSHAFHITEMECSSIDPQHRILLEVVQNARAQASMLLSQSGKDGVIVGISSNEFCQISTMVPKSLKATGGFLSVACGRISYVYNFTGPSMCIDTACSSSLVSLHLSNRTLTKLLIRIFSGGVNITLLQSTSSMFASAGMLSSDGRCKVLDALADGYVRSEECIIALLANFQEKDHIVIEVKGSAVSQDGRSSSLTAPNGPSQKDCINMAIADISEKVEVLEFFTFDLLQLHGTGTALGDPIEFGALHGLNNVTSKNEPLVVSASKSRSGHKEPASGLFGLKSLEINEPFMDSGLDSLGLLELRQSVMQHFDIDLPSTVSFDYPTSREMDPQQRILLESCLKYFTSSRKTVGYFQGYQIGIYLGVMWTEYQHLLRFINPDRKSIYLGTGNGLSFLLGRPSFVFGLNGPSCITDTACSSSLVALHLSQHALMSAECIEAFVGGIQCMILAETFMIMNNLKALSSDSRCKTLDVSANGYGRGEGTTLLYLGSYDEESLQWHIIRIRGSSVNQDGRSSSFTSPYGPSQQNLIKDALKKSNLNYVAGLISLHGTGTSLGDPIEVSALKEVCHKDSSQYLTFASSKSFFGHTEGAAGLTGLILACASIFHKSFDTEIFRVSPPEATLMDPQQRILLSLVYNLKSCKNVMYTQRTGVTVGISGSEYGRLASAVNVYTATGGALSVASGRISYIFGLQGICVSVDTACSSSLVGLHLAISNMVISECDASISCGSNVTLSNVTTEMFNRAGMLSIDGRCKVLDAKADGYVRGEACVALFMNTLKNSEESMHGPQIGGSATNQDGRSSSLTAPNGPSQQRVIRSALQSDEDALIVRMEGIELHGTGTSLGDPIEVGAICAVFTEHSQRSLVVSAAKSFVGHTEPASGIVGLIFSANNIQARSFQTILHLQTVNFYLVEKVLIQRSSVCRHQKQH